MREQHRMSDSCEYGIWTDMKTRCYNKNATSFKDYGGRGIEVCERWRRSFSAFFLDMGHRPTDSHSIERKDVNGNYCPENCIWATDIEQANNKRTTVRAFGEPISNLVLSSGIKHATLYRRVKQGSGKFNALGVQALTLQLNGKTKTVAEWSKETGIKATTITMRVTKYGWPTERALTEGATRCA